MSKFKVGEKVRLVKEVSNPKMQLGDEFTVQYIANGSVYVRPGGIRPIPGGGWTPGESDGWLPCRFELVKRKRDYVADHARRTLRKAGLPKDVAAKVVRNIQNSGNYSLSKFSRELPWSASAIILAGFDWQDSPEGMDYWAREHTEQLKREGTQNA